MCARYPNSSLITHRSAGSWAQQPPDEGRPEGLARGAQVAEHAAEQVAVARAAGQAPQRVAEHLWGDEQPLDQPAERLLGRKRLAPAYGVRRERRGRAV